MYKEFECVYFYFSIFIKSPAHLIEEIILVDDYSDDGKLFVLITLKLLNLG